MKTHQSRLNTRNSRRTLTLAMALAALAGPALAQSDAERISALERDVAALKAKVGIGTTQPAAAQQQAKAKPRDRAAASKLELKVYHIGNSVTDTIRYSPMQKLAASQGNSYVYGRHMMPGTPLDGLWKGQDKGFTEQPYGASQNALANFSWDVVTLQPFVRMIDAVDANESDFETCSKFLDLIVAKNPDTQVYIFQRWATRDLVDKANAKWDGTDAVKPIDYQAKWNRPYTAKWDGTYETADFFAKLTDKLNSKYEGQLTKPIRIIPVGDVVAEFDRRIRAGEVPGLKTIDEIYTDQIHFNEIGSFLVGATCYATMFGDSPEGLKSEPYGKVPAEVAEQIRQSIAQVIERSR